MALITLGGVLKKLGVEAALWDFDLYFKKAGNTTEAGFSRLLKAGVVSAGTKIFGISSLCSNFPMAVWISKKIKEYCPDALIILGGPQPSSIPTQILEQFDFIDVVAAGEGEVTLEEMVRCNFDRAALAEIPGVAVRIGQEIKFNTKRPLVADMDDLPMPDWSLLDLKEYYAPHLEKFPTPVEVGRGCPYNCTFCSTALMWQKDFRVKSPRRILDEMELLHREYDITEFEFVHDNFTTSKKFVGEFCDFMERENTKNFLWHAASRTDCLDIPRLEKMHAVGLKGLFFGIETGSERMQKVIKKGLQFDRFEPILRRANELEIVVTTAFILGFPDEEAEDFDQTVRRALHYKNLDTRWVVFSKLAALTGTDLYRNYVDKLTTPSGLSVFSPQYYGLPYINDLIKKHPDLFSSFYHVPHRLFSSEFLGKFVQFASLLVNGNPKTTLMIMENLRIGVVELFSLWDDWALERDIPCFRHHSYSYERFRKDFAAFLNDVIFKGAIAMTHGGSEGKFESSGHAIFS